jgi:hypothetical protein
MSVARFRPSHQIRKPLISFQKKTPATSKQDKDIAEARYRAVVNARTAKK